jgi:HPt (histidine-containing phosphotransfer) domain-containing protein
MGGIAIAEGMTPALDEHVLQKLESKVGRETVLRLVALFRNATEARLAMLPDLESRGDFAVLRQMAHDWISDAAAIGALTLSNAARQVEQLAIARDKGAWLAAESLALTASEARIALDNRFGEAA